MKVIVQKFGGTSVQDQETGQYAIGNIKKAIEEGYKVVVLVFAMGRSGAQYATDTLISLIGGQSTLLSKREQVVLLSCGETISSVVFTQELLENDVLAAALSRAQ